MRYVILAAALFTFSSSVLTAHAGSSAHKERIVANIAKHERYAEIEGLGQQAIGLLYRILIPMKKNEFSYYDDRFQVSERHYGFAADLGFRDRCVDIPGQSMLECTLKRK
ncbi:hypothetical protein [Bartonella doshiae]|uniref:Uncharacterized protein n=2 Tax=Bartonella doshiae TaxID=33044 RepID=A0A380ZET3_BARDO|nr:hypothetical protein [Bartonella doshiae]EJF79121.1 hypothetical protein MCS_01492 [Bartonella doshiae NCTC 12862 = ATCC 700133]MBB6160106.1 hypothetical protein [Bartonella doshiae]SUV45473.1 Uncharacterised protein [Bartonella doshiae]